MTGICGAESQSGTPVTAYINGVAIVVLARPDRYFICTRNPGHHGSHTACDGHGHVLAGWSQNAPGAPQATS